MKNDIILKRVAKRLTKSLEVMAMDLNKGKLADKEEEQNHLQALRHHMSNAKWKNRELDNHKKTSKNLDGIKAGRDKHIEHAKKHAKKLGISEKEITDEIEGKRIEPIAREHFDSHWHDRKLEKAATSLYKSLFGDTTVTKLSEEEPTKKSLFNDIKWKVETLKSINQQSWIIRQELPDLKDLFESKYSALKAEIKALHTKYKAAKKSDTDDMDLLKGVDDELYKGGEGSRGGKIIGHTKSGKAIYHNSHLNDNKGFTTSDHHDAHLAHNFEKQKASSEGKNAKLKVHTKGSEHHWGKVPLEHHPLLKKKFPTMTETYEHRKNITENKYKKKDALGKTMKEIQESSTKLKGKGKELVDGKQTKKSETFDLSQESDLLLKNFNDITKGCGFKRPDGKGSIQGKEGKGQGPGKGKNKENGCDLNALVKRVLGKEKLNDVIKEIPKDLKDDFMRKLKAAKGK